MASPADRTDQWRCHSRYPTAPSILLSLKLEQEGFIASSWDVSANQRKAKYYELTRAGKKHVQDETRQWEQTVNIMAMFFNRG